VVQAGSIEKAVKQASIPASTLAVMPGHVTGIFFDRGGGHKVFGLQAPTTKNKYYPEMSISEMGGGRKNCPK